MWKTDLTHSKNQHIREKLFKNHFNIEGKKLPINVENITTLTITKRNAEKMEERFGAEINPQTFICSILIDKFDKYLGVKREVVPYFTFFETLSTLPETDSRPIKQLMYYIDEIRDYFDNDKDYSHLSSRIDDYTPRNANIIQEYSIGLEDLSALKQVNANPEIAKIPFLSGKYTFPTADQYFSVSIHNAALALAKKKNISSDQRQQLNVLLSKMEKIWPKAVLSEQEFASLRAEPEEAIRYQPTSQQQELLSLQRQNPALYQKELDPILNKLSVAKPPRNPRATRSARSCIPKPRPPVKRRSLISPFAQSMCIT